MITVLVPTYREGSLLSSCLRSVKDLPGVDHIAVFEGPVGGAERSSERHIDPFLPDAWGSPKRPVYARLGDWEDDAAKRTDMLGYAKERHAERYKGADAPLWILWLDADEVLLYGEYLIDWVNRAEKMSAAGGFALRIVELDGSVAKSSGRIVRGDLILHYLLAASQLQLTNGLVISLPNTQICGPGGIPAGYGEREIKPEDLAELRPPLMGEPHILHRSILRDPERAKVATRQHEPESQWFQDKGVA